MAVLASTIFLGAPASAESATSVRDLVQLKEAGLSDDILIALIQSDGSIFNLSSNDIIEIRRQGLSEKVILAMIATRRPDGTPVVGTRDPNPRAIALPATPEPPAKLEHPEPVVVHVTQTVTQTVEVPQTRTETRYVAVPVAIPVAVRPREPVKAPEPVYWGFGGERRPGTWDPAPASGAKPPAAPAKPGGGGG